MQLSLRILDIAARLMLSLGIGCLLLAAYLLWKSNAFDADVMRTTGRVVGYQPFDDEGTTRYWPRVRFKTEDGSIVTDTINTQIAATTKRFAEGSEVPIYYQRTKPMDARIALFVDNWLAPCIAGAMGIAGMLGGWLVRRSVRREMVGARTAS